MTLKSKLQAILCHILNLISIRVKGTSRDTKRPRPDRVNMKGIFMNLSRIALKSIDLSYPPNFIHTNCSLVWKKKRMSAIASFDLSTNSY